MAINVSPACHSTVRFCDQKKCFSPSALSGSSPVSPCPDRRAAALRVGSQPAACPAQPAGQRSRGRECCFSLKKQKEEKNQSNRTKGAEPVHVGLCSPQPRRLPLFRRLLCFAGLVYLHLQNALMSEHPLSDQKGPVEGWRGADLGACELSHQKPLLSKAGCSQSAAAGPGELTATETRANGGGGGQAGYRCCSACWLLSWDAVFMCTVVVAQTFPRGAVFCSIC